MYEEKPRKTIVIDWKSLLIKLAILFAVVFIIIWIVSLFNKDEKESNFGVNIQSMREAADDYFTGSRLPSGVNEKEVLTLGEMFDKKLLVEFQDEEGNSCDIENSYAEVTKIDEENYRLEIRLICNNDSDTIINTIHRPISDDEKVIDDEKEEIKEEEKPVKDEEEDTDKTTNSTTNKPSTSKPTTSKPNNNTSSKPNTSVGTTTKPNNNTTTKPSKPVTTTCSYGKIEYYSLYPLAYVVSGDCAVSLSSISGSHANSATRVGNTEYKKLLTETRELEKKTGVDLVVSNPEYAKIKNKAGTGFVGYQIYFTVKEKISTYGAKTIYAYYLDQKGNRKVVIDSRNSLGSNTNSTIIKVTSLTLNRSSITMDVGDTYYLSATINPSNATNQKITWSSTDTSVATINNGKITAKGSGEAIITASIGNVKDTVKVRVLEDGYIKFSRSSITLDVKDTYQIKYDTNLSGTIKWSSTDTSVATVSRGKITAKGSGDATITASIGGVKDTLRVTVEDDTTYYYCSTNTKRVYSIGVISESTIDDRNTYRDSYQVVLNSSDDLDIIDVDYGNITYNDEYLKAYNYWKNKSELTLIDGSNKKTYDPGKYGTLRDSSLKEDNFSVRVSYDGRVGNKYIFTIDRRLSNLNNIRYAKTYRNNYYLPLYIDIKYVDYDDCEYITSSEVKKYERDGYILVD